MKPIVIIINIYFLLLVVIPCHCSIINTVDYSTTTQVLSLHSNTDTDHEVDICTPFCSCANIHYPNFIIQNNALIKPCISFSSKKFTVYNESSTSSFSGSLLRPPQV